MRIRVQAAPFDPGAELTAFSRTAKGAGAIISFTGITRDLPGASLRHMLVEHYPGMTEKTLNRIATLALKRWSLKRVLILHRYGRMAPGDPIMMVATAAKHRAEAFQAAGFLMDYMKSRAPFWKKEVSEAGETWVKAREEDETALNRWQA
ncbi:MAG: molybdenum cofactor biosynthesis protein MoaE [Rhodobacteraceae bacterium]|nr:molybdenum cofactor biosynthesis protein MoaE [Paracoccaceae bacterium]